jgi:two-component system sensor histidine kinase UhpB
MLAQEAERTEIARDLHDDVGQQLAALEIGLSLLETRTDGNGDIRDEVTRLRQMTSALAEKVRHVSHSLHPGVLHHAGLSAAISSHCETIADQHPFLVTFETRGTFADVPDDVALCLYRAAQQALRNVAMHADARQVRVSLARAGHQVELTITDDGRPGVRALGGPRSRPGPPEHRGTGPCRSRKVLGNLQAWRGFRADNHSARRMISLRRLV